MINLNPFSRGDKAAAAQPEQAKAAPSEPAKQPADSKNAPQAANTDRVETKPAAMRDVVMVRRAQTAHAYEQYHEMVERLAPQITEQVAQVEAAQEKARAAQPEAVKQVEAAPAWTPSPMVLALDLTGKEQRSCDPCAKSSPANKRLTPGSSQWGLGLKVDLLVDSLVVFLEVARRTKTPHAVITYDENRVEVLRELGNNAGSDSDVVEAVIARINERDGVVVRAGPTAAAALAQTGVGPARDGEAIQTGSAMLKDGGSLLVVKSTLPATNLKTLVDKTNKRIRYLGVAVGDQSSQVSRGMFEDTRAVPDYLALRKSMGVVMTRATKPA